MAATMRSSRHPRKSSPTWYAPKSSHTASCRSIFITSRPNSATSGGPASEALTKTPTPGKVKCEDVAAMLGLPLSRTVKSIVLTVEKDKEREVWLLLLRGDHEMNEVKVKKIPGLAEHRFASEAEIV